MTGYTVLFANDDVLTQWIMTDVLQGLGYSVVSACRGYEVLALLQDAPDFDVLILDVGLPDTPARLDLCHHWRVALPGRPIIHTGIDADALRRPLGFLESFARTPLEPGALLRMIDAALADACFHGPMVAPPTHSQYVH